MVLPERERPPRAERSFLLRVAPYQPAMPCPVLTSRVVVPEGALLCQVRICCSTKLADRGTSYEWDSSTPPINPLQVSRSAELNAFPVHFVPHTRCNAFDLAARRHVTVPA
eukprot:1710169-Rhodomonas_salina.2